MSSMSTNRSHWVEVQVHEPGRAVPVLRDDQLGGAFHALARAVHLLPINHQHHIGILLDRAEAAEVIQRRPGIGPATAETGQLGHHQHDQVPLHARGP